MVGFVVVTETKKFRSFSIVENGGGHCILHNSDEHFQDEEVAGTGRDTKHERLKHK